jgi:predicted enzyme related to lactoylglutathione lyase
LYTLERDNRSFFFEKNLILIMFKKLRTIIYHVSNLEEAKQWYAKVTGIAPYFDEPFYVGFDINGCELGLDPNLTHSNSGEHSVAYWQVDNINEATENLIANGAKIVSTIQDVGGGISVSVLADPFGNHIGLIEEKTGE